MLLEEIRLVDPDVIVTLGTYVLFPSTHKEGCRILQGFSRVMTRPAGRVKGVSKSRGSGRIGSLRFEISRVGSSRVKRFSKSRGSGRVGSRLFKISRVGSGGVKRFQNLAGRVESGQDASKSRESGRVGSRCLKTSRVGSGRVKRFSQSRGSGRVMTREIRVTSGVKP